MRQEQPRGQGQGQGVGPGQQRDRSLGVNLRRSALLSCDERNLLGCRPPMQRSVKRYGAYMLLKLQKVGLPRFPRPAQWPKTGQFFLKAFCKMAIFRPLAARSPQRPPGPAWRNKVLADSADDPDDADKPDDLNESNKSDDSDDSLMTSSASYPNCKKWSWPRFPRPA